MHHAEHKKERDEQTYLPFRYTFSRCIHLLKVYVCTHYTHYVIMFNRYSSPLISSPIADYDSVR